MVNPDTLATAAYGLLGFLVLSLIIGCVAGPSAFVGVWVVGAFFLLLTLILVVGGAALDSIIHKLNWRKRK